jgi:UDP-3-O-[3-hydroxymyristoyl] glucosamine N-acyltransferase
MVQPASLGRKVHIGALCGIGELCGIGGESNYSHFPIEVYGG